MNLQTYWFGAKALKNPFDMWVYQEIIYDVKPDLIIETGTYLGGSTLFLANIFDLLGKGKVVSIDIEHKPGLPTHKRITYIKGSSVSEEVLKKIKRFIKNSKKVMVILDSDHHEPHVSEELQIYSQFVTRGSYLIVEDSNLNGNPVRSKYGPGPMEAIIKFLKTNNKYRIDKSREKLLITFNPSGFLKRIS